MHRPVGELRDSPTVNEPRLLTDDRERRELIAVCARAFWHDPLFDFLAGGDLLTAHQMLPAVFRAAMRDFEAPTARRYVVDLDGRPRAFAGWLGPGSFPRPRVAEAIRNLRSAELLVKVRERRAALRLLQEVEKRHPHEPHWYLALLATDPTAQGRGFGSALLRPVLAECDEQGDPRLPGDTEGSQPRLVRPSGIHLDRRGSPSRATHDLAAVARSAAVSSLRVGVPAGWRERVREGPPRFVMIARRL